MKASSYLVFLISISFVLPSICVAEQGVSSRRVLKLEKEKSLHSLIGTRKRDEDHEASGVTFANNRFYVVFDNNSQIARIDFDLEKVKLLGKDDEDIGYEGISNTKNMKYYAVEESIKRGGKFNARLHVLDSDFAPKDREWIKYNFKDDSKGIEGIAIVERDNKTYALALCEGNFCESEEEGKLYGAGRIVVLENNLGKWKYLAFINLPRTLQFIDYSGIAIGPNSMLAVTSQESSSMWVGKLDQENWKIDDVGVVYDFPRDENGNKVYCNVEGVAWVTSEQVVVVSDARKSKQLKQCKKKEQSIHIMSMNNT